MSSWSGEQPGHPRRGQPGNKSISPSGIYQHGMGRIAPRSSGRESGVLGNCVQLDAVFLGKNPEVIQIAFSKSLKL